MLGSGSAGNATLVSHADTRVLLDAGFSYRELSRRLREVGVEPGMLDAVLITHGHGDHTRGLRTLSNRHGVRACATAAIRDEWRAADEVDWHVLAPGAAMDLGGLRFIPFEVPHDASETVAFRIETPEGAIGYATDMGTLTPSLIDRFRDCRLLVIESNHATELLRVSPYARSTRERIAGAGGHLSNESLAAFVRDHLGASVRCLVLAHLSRVNNLPELARMTCCEALSDSGRTDVQVVVAHQDRVTPTIDLAALAHPAAAAAPMPALGAAEVHRRTEGAQPAAAAAPLSALRQTALPFTLSSGPGPDLVRNEVRSR